MNFNFFKKREEQKIDTPKEILPKFEVRYRYEWNEDIPENERNTTEHPSRPFCVKLMNASKFFTRQDIQKMSSLLGYDVFLRKGGDGCRHRWVSQVVTKKE